MVCGDHLVVNNNFALFARKEKKSEDISASVLILKHGKVPFSFKIVDSSCKYILKPSLASNNSKVI